jgi:multisubunit Na+/H+ antiporter MnhB subunit
MTTTLALVLSAVFAVLAPIGYIISIIRGRSRPHRITRFILFFVLTLNFASILAAGGSPGAKLFAGIVFAQGTAIFAISLWRGMGGSSIFDWSCFAIALIGVIGWKLTGSPLVGVLFSVLADLAAYLPAFVKTWKHPHTESPWFISRALSPPS